MITRLEIDGFKTFTNFTMEFTPFTVIAGTNASGKSNIFDALTLLSKLYSPISQEISIEILSQLPSFNRFLEDVRKALRTLNYLN